MQVVMIQLNSVWESPAVSHTRAQDCVRAAQPPPGSLVVLPEMFATGFTMEVSRFAEEPRGATWGMLRSLAKDFGVYVVGGFAEKTDESTHGLNTCVVFSPQGEELSRYHKIHPFSYGGEDKHYRKGDSLPVFELGDFRAATPICYDLRFPELFRRASHQGANLFIVPASWPAARRAHWRLLARARALENLAWVIAVNRTGEGGGLHYPGASLIVSPLGEVLFEGDDHDEVVGGQIDAATLHEVRGRFHFLEDVRGDLFPDLFAP